MNIALIQARMGSTRLPGKVLKEVNGEPLIRTLLNRISPAKTVDEFVVVTTTNSEDDALYEYCKENNIKCFRGSDWDVLDRFYQAIKWLDNAPKAIVRICCDNPLHSHKVVDFVVSEFESSGKSYFSNSNQEPDYLEDGFDVEVFTFDALKDAWENAKLLSEREHVCPYIKKNFDCGWKRYNIDYNYKLSVDTSDDFAAVERIFAELKDKSDFGMNEVVELLKAKPEILELNKNSKINSGYQKSLNEDKIVK